MSDTPPRSDAAMADILASIRRIVAEEDRRPVSPARVDSYSGRDDVLVLTADMRVDDVEADGSGLVDPVGQIAAPSIDEAVVADIARTVVREELNGPLGITLTQNIKRMIREEIARALDERR